MEKQTVNIYGMVYSGTVHSYSKKEFIDRVLLTQTGHYCSN